MEDKLHSSRSTLTMPNDNWSFLTSGRKIKNWKGEGSQRLQQSLQNLKQHGQDPYFMKKLGDLQTDIMTHVGMNLPKSLMGQKSRSMVFNNLPVIIKIYIQYQQIRVFQPEPSSSFSKFPPIIIDNSSSARYMGQIIQANENFNRVDYAMNEGIHFDEIWHNCDKEIRKINDDLERFVRQWPPCSFIDKFKGPFFLYPWQDPVVWNIIMTIKDKERELALILSNIPHYTQLHQLRSEKLRKLTSYRIEMERLMEQLANEYRKPCFTTIVIERPRTPPKKVDPKKLISFNIFWDFILRFFANCRAKRIVYGIYNRGEPQITPRFAHAKLITQHEVDESNAVYYEYTSIFNAHHLVKDLLVDPNSILVFEVQGNVQSKAIFYRPEDFDIYSGSGIGYPLYRNRTDDDELSLDMNMKLGEEETLAWSVLDLFTQQENLITGNFKVPLYLPPADTNINLFKFPEIVQRIPLTNVFMRIESYYTTDTDKIKRGELPRIQASQYSVFQLISQQYFMYNGTQFLTPDQESSYWVPDLHNFPANYCNDLRIMKEADKSYNSRGINPLQSQIHHVEGITPEKHVRVGYLIQFGKYVVKSVGGMFCFFATSGKNPFNLLGLKKLKKKDKEKEVAPSSIPIDEGIQWEKNFYKMISHYWEIGLKKNLNVVLLYLQLKEGVKPTAKASITKSLLEEEYDLLGYTVYRLNDEKGRVRYGTHTVPLFDGPPYIEDIREQDKNGGTITFTIGDFGKPIQEIHIPIKDVIAQKADEYIAKNTPNGSPQKTNTFNPPSQGGQSTFAKIQQAKLISGQKNTPNTFNNSINQRAQSPFGDTIHTENGRLSPVAQHPQKNLNNDFNSMTSPKKAPKVITANNLANQNPASTQPFQQKNPQSRQRPPSISFKPDTLKPPSRFNNTDKNKPNLVIDRNTPKINIGNLDSNKNDPQPSQAPPKKKKPKRPTSEKKPNRVKMVQRDMQQQPPK